METITIIWLTLGFISVLALIYTFSVGNNSIWGGFIIGIFIGLVIALKFYFQDKGFDWLTLVKGGIIGSIAGTIFSFFDRR